MAGMKLKNCPFCGSFNINDTTVHDHYGEELGGGRAVCPDCCACAPYGKEQIRLWNARTSDSTIEAQEAEIKRLRKALEFYANEDNYDDDSAPFKMVISHECVHEFMERDLGKIAQAALKEE